MQSTGHEAELVKVAYADGKSTACSVSAAFTSDATRILFKGRVTDPIPTELEPEDISISPL